MTIQMTWVRVVTAALVGWALAGAAGAQEASKAPAGGPALRPLLGLGLTVGGDPIPITYIDEETGDVQRVDYVKLGQFWQLYGGLEYQVGPRFSLQATLNYHADTSSDFGGVFRFSRYPVELLGHYHLSEEWRFGGGLRYIKNPKFVGSGERVIGGAFEVEFEDTTGLVLETEYRVNRSFGLKLRLVAEKYELKPPFDGDKLDGSHAGLMLNWYLF